MSQIRPRMNAGERQRIDFKQSCLHPAFLRVPRSRVIRVPFYRHHFTTGTNFTHTHRLTAIVLPVSFPPPVAGSSPHTPTLPPSWLAISIHFPLGSMLKFRGTLMSPVMCPAAVSLRSSFTLNTAMLLCPRFDTYTNFPSGDRMHSA